MRDGRYFRALSTIIAWGWTALAGGGGLLLLIEKGPQRLTNGWFALLSGLAACPLTASLAMRTGLVLSSKMRFVCAAGIWGAGQITRAAGY